MSEYTKPLPQPTEISQPFWDACRQHELRIQRCTGCGTLIHYPQLRCPEDGSQDFEWAQMSGRGQVYSYAISRRAYHPGFDVPYVIAVVALDEGPRLMSDLRGIAPDDVRVGMEVEVVFDDVTAEITLPRFRPIS